MLLHAKQMPLGMPNVLPTWFNHLARTWRICISYVSHIGILQKESQVLYIPVCFHVLWAWLLLTHHLDPGHQLRVLGPYYLPAFEKSNAGHIRARCKPNNTLGQDISFVWSKNPTARRKNMEDDTSFIKFEPEGDIDGIMAASLQICNTSSISPKTETASSTLDIKDVKQGVY